MMPGNCWTKSAGCWQKPKNSPDVYLADRLAGVSFASAIPKKERLPELKIDGAPMEFSTIYFCFLFSAIFMEQAAQGLQRREK